MATLREQIAQQEADHKEEIYRLERKQVVDKDRCVAHFDVNILTKRVANVPILYYSCITILNPRSFIFILERLYMFLLDS